MVASTTANVIASETVVATASQPLPPIGEEIFDLMGAVRMSYPWQELLYKAFITILALWLIYVFYKWLTTPVERKRKAIVQSSETLALRAIKRLKISDVWAKEDIKSICENLVAIVKDFALEKYKLGIGASGTTDEFIPVLINGGVKNQVLSEIKEMFEFCDEVRYTGQLSTKRSPEDLVATVEKLIEMKWW